jgi:NTP pyrophosphatase (non-canonical NTP hydrolase)
MTVLLAGKAVEVCEAITEKTTFEYIKDEENYRWYIIMCNMPFFNGRLEWGTSMRGAWWDHKITFQSCGLWEGEKQLHEEMTFTQEEWGDFMRAVISFANEKSTDPKD